MLNARHSGSGNSRRGARVFAGAGICLTRFYSVSRDARSHARGPRYTYINPGDVCARGLARISIRIAFTIQSLSRECVFASCCLTIGGFATTTQRQRPRVRTHTSILARFSFKKYRKLTYSGLAYGVSDTLASRFLHFRGNSAFERLVAGTRDCLNNKRGGAAPSDHLEHWNKNQLARIQRGENVAAREKSWQRETNCIGSATHLRRLTTREWNICNLSEYPSSRILNPKCQHVARRARRLFLCSTTYSIYHAQKCRTPFMLDSIVSRI